MTPTQFKRKYRELAARAHQGLIEKGEEALKAIDLNDFEDDYVLPKIVLTAALENSVYVWRPLDRNHRRHVMNLKIFI